MNTDGFGHRLLRRAQKAVALARGGFRGFPVTTIPGEEILLPFSARSHFWSGPSEDARLFEFLAAAIPEDGCYVDIGGNVGLYVAALSKAKAGRLRSVSFEPIASSAAILRQTLALNGVKDARVEEIALSSEPGMLRLSNFPGGLNNFWVQDERSAVPQVEVPKTSLDVWMAEHPTYVPHAMKIDVEGHELEVLKGAQKTLQARKPALVIECHCASWSSLGVSRLELVGLVASLGYRSATTQDGRLVDLLTQAKTTHLMLSDAAC